MDGQTDGLAEYNKRERENEREKRENALHVHVSTWDHERITLLMLSTT